MPQRAARRRILQSPPEESLETGVTLKAWSVSNLRVKFDSFAVHHFPM
jgi:hypothetical protein